MKRREFLVATGACAVAGPVEGAGDTGWFDRPMRWSQLTLVEDDPGKFDPDFWLDYFRRIHSDAVCLSAGGIVAYYPTEVKLHHRSRWLNDFQARNGRFAGDPFGYLVEGCRKQNMVVIARTDPHAVLDDVQQAHPDWIQHTADGKPRRHWADPSRWVTCALGPYNWDFMNDVNREIVSRYQVDAIFSNRWAGHGDCYCPHCRRMFRDKTGREIPIDTNPAGETRRLYLEWREQRLFEIWRHWDAAIRQVRPAACFIPNSGGGAGSELDMRRVGEMAPILFADRQARRGLTAPWANGKNAKEYRSALGMKPIGGIFSVGVEEPYRWKDSVQSDAEIRIWVADGVAQGLRPWWTKFAGVVRDPRWLDTVAAVYQRLARWEPYLRNIEPLAEVGLVYSQQTSRYYKRSEEAALGFYQALTEARIPFEMVHDQKLDDPLTRRLRVLILPNIACLSDAQCAQLSAFVHRGGALIATFETSLYDERGRRRPDFGLAPLFGARFEGRVEGPLQNSYLRLEHDTRHPVLRGLEKAPRIINASRRVTASPTLPLDAKPVTFVPSYPDLPMEMVFPTQERTGIPELYLRTAGQGRVAYVPGDLDRTFWEVLAPDHAVLLKNVVDWAARDSHPLRVTGPGWLDVALWRQSKSITVHLVNLTNPMAMKGPYRELIPLGRQTVSVRLPAGVKPRQVRLLTAGTTAEADIRDGWLTCVVPRTLDHEIVAIDLS
ncbi:MAG: beta-galactosidase trimerization domain-containing protein [Bryobacterales bacterium]|nr:beta-galactosidase trimerization domain-containing protein [Bryobacterales bacterium]